MEKLLFIIMKICVMSNRLSTHGPPQIYPSNLFVVSHAKHVDICEEVGNK